MKQDARDSTPPSGNLRTQQSARMTQQVQVTDYQW